MSAENNLPFKTRELIGFKIAPNTAADTLESHLGIKFPIKPNVVIMDWRNKLKLAGTEGIAPFLGSILSERISGAVGHYDARYHAYFTGKGGDLFTSLHENMHGYNASINFDFGTVSFQLADKVESRTKGLAGNPIDVEKTMVLRCIDEGIAQWAALEVASQLTDDFEKEDVNIARNEMLNSRDDITNNASADTKFMENEYKKVQDAVDLYNQAFNQCGLKVMQLGFKAERLSKDAQYTTGYYFVERAMRTLTESGLSVSEALTTLVKNPPTTIDELKDPAVYLAQQA